MSSGAIAEPVLASAVPVGPGRILVVEDDQDIRKTLHAALTRDGHTVTAVPSGSEAILAMRRSVPDLVLLDLTLPDTDGLQLLGFIRQKYALPVILVTGRDGSDDHVRGLELGAADYITKPFEISVLRARVRTQLRTLRADSQVASSVISLAGGRLFIDETLRVVVLDDEELALSPREYELLILLARNCNRQVVSRVQIQNEIWRSTFNTSQSVSEYIRRLRVKLRPLEAAGLEIRLVRTGEPGYRLVDGSDADPLAG